MSRNLTAVRPAGGWLALAGLFLAVTLVFHGPLAPSVDEQMDAIASGATRWLLVHWLAAVGLSSLVVAAILVIAAGSRLTATGWTISAWAVLPVSALWTVATAVAEATAVTDAALAGDRVIFAAWWAYSEGMGNGFAALALCVAVIAANEMRDVERATPAWAAGAGAAAAVASFLAWALWSWLGVGAASPVWVGGSVLMCLWLLWFGVGLARGPRG